MSEVPQGNQDGASCPFCNGTASATGIRPQPCHSCGGAGVITAASSGSEPSTASENASEGGSQDSIDSLEEILINYSPVTNRSEATRFRLAKEALTAWHNTQLKAAIPEKNDLDLLHKAEKNGTLHSEEKEILLLKEGYNQAIDDMQANLEKP